VKPSGFRVRAVHVICTSLVLLSVASMAWGLRLAPPVPVDGSPLGAIWFTLLVLAGFMAAITAWQVKPLEQRVAVLLVTAFCLPVLGATAIPDLLCAINASKHQGPAEQHVERLVELKHESLGKHRERQVLITRPFEGSLGGQSLHHREISRSQFSALQASAWPKHQPLAIEVAQGLLGWRFVRSVKEATVLPQ
jgi:hypothetical protein